VSGTESPGRYRREGSGPLQGLYATKWGRRLRSLAAARPSTGVHHEPGKPCLTWDDSPRSFPDHRPHPGPFASRFLSTLLTTRRQGHRTWSRWRYLLASVIPIARSALSRRAWPPR